MDFDQIKDALKFLNWEMLGAIGLITMATVQFLKGYIPDIKAGIPILKIFTLVVGLIIAHFCFDIAGVKHTETVALFHGFVGALFASLGYEILKGTKAGLRSSDEIKKP
jgi:hypothetical protein